MTARPLNVGALAGLIAGASGLGAAATWHWLDQPPAAADALAFGLAALAGAGACALWSRKAAADDQAALDLDVDALELSLARRDWEPPAGSAAADARELRPVALAPVEAALLLGVPAPAAVAALLAELARAGVAHYEPGTPPVVSVGRAEAVDGYGRMLAVAGPGTAVTAAIAAALASHAAAEASQKLAAGGHAASAQWYRARWHELAMSDGAMDEPADDPMGRPPATRAFARDALRALDPEVPAGTAWVSGMAARLAPDMPPVQIDTPQPIIVPADAGLHTAVAAGAEVGAALPEGA
ncbi:MAG: hypothetical protein ACYTGX_15060 [Planctomycetota bacterium]